MKEVGSVLNAPHRLSRRPTSGGTSARRTVVAIGIDVGFIHIHTGVHEWPPTVIVDRVERGAAQRAAQRLSWLETRVSY